MPNLTPVQGNPFAQAGPRLTKVQGNPFAKQPQESPEQEQPGILERVGKAFTGADRMTDEIANLPEIGEAPELNELSVPAFKASLGLLTTGDTNSLRGILERNLGEKDTISGQIRGSKVKFREDEQGNTIVDLPSGSYALNKPGFSGQDAIRTVATMLAFTPAGRSASVAGAIGKNAATEAALQGTEKTLGGQDMRADQVALAGGIGGAFKGVENVVGAGYRALKGTADDSLVKAGEDAGVRILTSDAFEPKTFPAKMAQQTGEKIPLAGTGGIRETQQVAREKAVADIAEKYGEYSYDAIIKSLKTQKDRVKQAAGSVLEATGRRLDEAGEIAMPNTREALVDVFTELGRKGVMRTSTARDDLEELVTTLAEAPQTFTTLKENRTAFNELVKGLDKAERSQLNSREKALLTRVAGALKRDMDDHARANLSPQEFAKWQRANSTYAEEARKLTKSRLKSVLDKGDVTPESVQTLLFSQKPSEVKSLYQSLTPEGRANARAAIISKVFGDLNKRASGVTPNAFASEMKKYGSQTDIFFKGADRKQLRGLVKVLDATRRAQDASVTTPTGQQLLGAGTLAAAATDLGATVGLGGTLGLFARAYESRPVRNALLRLDSLPPGSTQFEQAAGEAVRLLTAGTQTARRASSDKESRPAEQQEADLP